MRTILVAFVLALFGGCGSLPADPTSDAPERQQHVAAFKDAVSYPQALRIWRGPEDVDAWIGAKFHYDLSRAMLLSENQRGRSGPLPIRQAHEFFADPTGVCVDLSRFTVETLRHIDPGLDANYLRIEFSPVTVGGNTLRVHWLASFKRDGKHYFLGDSKRPGHIAGPYESVQQFIADYSAYRARPVVAFRVLDSYQRRQRTTATRLSREARP
jgi:hypothetical protein